MGIASPDSSGYWLVGADGGTFAFGDAHTYGSLPGLGVTPAQPIVGIAANQRWQGLLARRCRRRHLRIRRCAQLRIAPRPRDHALKTDSRDRRHRRRQGLLVGWSRRRHLRIRRCPQLRIAPRSRDNAGETDRRDDLPGQRRLLGGGSRRWHFRIRRCPLLRVPRRTPASGCGVGRRPRLSREPGSRPHQLEPASTRDSHFKSGSRGRPRIRSPIWFRVISEVPPAIVRARTNRTGNPTATSESLHQRGVRAMATAWRSPRRAAQCSAVTSFVTFPSGPGPAPDTARSTRLRFRA